MKYKLLTLLIFCTVLNDMSYASHIFEEESDKKSCLHNRRPYSRLSETQTMIEDSRDNIAKQDHIFDEIMTTLVKRGQPFNFSNMIKFSASYISNDFAFREYLKGGGIIEEKMIQYIRKECQSLSH